MSGSPSAAQRGDSEAKGELHTWIAGHAGSSGLSVRAVPLGECAEWRLDNAILSHRSGRFFSVVGYHCTTGPAHLLGLQLPMIDQPEIGILGFAVRRTSAGWAWLLQAKTEPGNVGGTQAGPTVQATYSNYMRVHGGRPTRMLELFDEHAVRGAMTDVEQSEQGDRFIGKFNRNVVVEVASDYPSPDDSAWRWFGATAMRDALEQDFVFNTDARSVMFCADWRLLSDDDVPFSRWRCQGGFGDKLLLSSLDSRWEEKISGALAVLDAAQPDTVIRFQRVGLDRMAGWCMDENEVRALEEGVDPRVRAYEIHALDREVEHWCQPLLINLHMGRVALACAMRDGTLQFLLIPSFEPGFGHRPQFAPSWVSGLGHANPEGLLEALDGPAALRHAQVLQSDEGGRFMHSVASYELVELDEHAARAWSDAGAWVSLGTLRRMVARRGLLTNELRSVCSLLLKWC